MIIRSSKFTGNEAIIPSINSVNRESLISFYVRSLFPKLRFTEYLGRIQVVSLGKKLIVEWDVDLGLFERIIYEDGHIESLCHFTIYQRNQFEIMDQTMLFKNCKGINEMRSILISLFDDLFNGGLEIHNLYIGKSLFKQRVQLTHLDISYEQEVLPPRWMVGLFISVVGIPLALALTLLTSHGIVGRKSLIKI